MIVAHYTRNIGASRGAQTCAPGNNDTKNMVFGAYT